EKADNLILLAQAFYESADLDSAWKYCDVAETLSIRIDYLNGRSEAVYKKGLIQNIKSDYNAALISVRKYLELVKPMDDNKGKTKGFFQLGTLLRQQGFLDSAMHYYRISLALTSESRDTARLIAIFNAMGNTMQEMSEFDSAAVYYLKTIRLCEESGNAKYLGKLYNNLGKTFFRLYEFDKARKYLELSMELNRKNNDMRSVALNLTNLGNISLNERKFDQALALFNQAADVLAPFGEVIEAVDLYINLASLYRLQHEYDLAIEYLKKALKYYSTQMQAEGTMKALKGLGDVYSDQKRYAMAIEAYDSCLNIATRTGFRKNRQEILYSLFDNYFKAGNYEKAFDYQSRYYNLKDSLFDMDKVKVINDLTLRYEKEKDQARILVLEKENLEKDLRIKQRTIQRNTYLYSGLIILVLVVFLFLYIHQKRVKDRIIARQQIHQLEEEKKLMAAKLLVEGQESERKRIAAELHDGLGVLLSATKMQFSIIKDKSPENKDLIEKASRMLEQASGDVRKISHNMMPGLLTKMGFYEVTGDLFENLNDISGTRATCIITGDQKRLPENREIMLYRIIQELVNNTLKHAEAQNIDLKIQVLENMLDISYTDDGKGFDVVQKLESGSVGLKSIQSRVNFLNGDMTLVSNPGQGLTFTMKIPLDS
ncbi:MAG: sensor histidine kinase, partial [Bacteroidales bacterium]|nr:sensor histidine kinase [Bacteroidales bacterium]